MIWLKAIVCVAIYFMATASANEAGIYKERWKDKFHLSKGWDRAMNRFVIFSAVLAAVAWGWEV